MLVWAGIWVFCSCNSYEYHTVTIALNDSCKKEQQSAAYEVILKRMAAIGHIKEKTNLIDGKFDVTYSGKDSLLTQALTQKGEIFVTEMYLIDELMTSLNPVFEKLLWLMENSGEEPLWYISDYQPGSSFALITVPLQQLAYIDSIFNSYKHLFPEDMSFAWTAKESAGYFHLFALKLNPRLIPFNPGTVKKCSVMKGYENRQELFLELAEKYHGEWARLTRDNISRNLAFVMDGKVLMYPKVQSEITGGNLVINGEYDLNELFLIRSVIMSGTLNCKAKIIN